MSMRAWMSQLRACITITGLPDSWLVNRIVTPSIDGTIVPVSVWTSIVDVIVTSVVLVSIASIAPGRWAMSPIVGAASGTGALSGALGSASGAFGSASGALGSASIGGVSSASGTP